MNLKYPISNMHNALMSFVFMTFCFEYLTEHTISTIMLSYLSQCHSVLTLSVDKSARFNSTEYVYASHCPCLYCW